MKSPKLSLRVLFGPPGSLIFHRTCWRITLNFWSIKGYPGVGYSGHKLTTPETHGTTIGAARYEFWYDSGYLSLKFSWGLSSCIQKNIKSYYANSQKRGKLVNHEESYIFQPTFLMFVLIDVWRITPKLRWTINPSIAFLFTLSCKIQASLTTFSSTVFVVGKTPSYRSTIIIGVKFCMTFRWKGSTVKNLLLWIELILGKYKEKDSATKKVDAYYF